MGKVHWNSIRKYAISMRSSMPFQRYPNDNANSKEFLPIALRESTRLRFIVSFSLALLLPVTRRWMTMKWLCGMDLRRHKEKNELREIPWSFGESFFGECHWNFEANSFASSIAISVFRRARVGVCAFLMNVGDGRLAKRKVWRVCFSKQKSHWFRGAGTAVAWLRTNMYLPSNNHSPSRFQWFLPSPPEQWHF